MLADTKNSVFWKSTYYLFLLFFITFPFANYSGFLYSGTSTRSLNLVVFSAVLGIAFADASLLFQRALDLIPGLF